MPFQVKIFVYCWITETLFAVKIWDLFICKYEQIDCPKANKWIDSLNLSLNGIVLELTGSLLMHGSVVYKEGLYCWH